MLEFDTLVLPLDPEAQQMLEAKGREGWILVPGTVPRVIYQICRPVQQQQPMPRARGSGCYASTSLPSASSTRMGTRWSATECMEP